MIVHYTRIIGIGHEVPLTGQVISADERNTVIRWDHSGVTETWRTFDVNHRMTFTR